MNIINDMLRVPLVLASASPRRADTLRSLGFSIIISPSLLDETVYDHLPVNDRVMALAELKARDGSAKTPMPPLLALGGDTLVTLDNHVLGKPSNAEEATAMLRLLSGKTHLVVSGLCLLDRQTGSATTAFSETKVSFSSLTNEEIEWYVSTGEWKGAAGAYRIQEGAALFIDSIEGSFSGVVGLPLHLFYAMISAIARPIPE
ncbi:MAG: Maf family protein [Spirochaetia bacterium]|jgi:septum formation protein|nr:Maf family protein [Spirochaetia bacterium]